MVIEWVPSEKSASILCVPFLLLFFSSSFFPPPFFLCVAGGKDQEEQEQGRLMVNECVPNNEKGASILSVPLLLSFFPSSLFLLLSFLYEPREEKGSSGLEAIECILNKKCTSILLCSTTRENPFLLSLFFLVPFSFYFIYK